MLDKLKKLISLPAGFSLTFLSWDIIAEKLRDTRIPAGFTGLIIASYLGYKLTKKLQS